MKTYVVMENVCGTMFVFSTLKKAKSFVLKNYVDFLKYVSIHFPEREWKKYEDAEKELEINNFIDDFMYIDEREVDKDEDYLIDWENT